MEYKPIILFFALLILFWWISSEDDIKVDDTTPSKEPKTQKGLKLKATATDGDNTVMVSTNDGEIKKSSNIAKLDALELRVNKICNEAGTSCIELGDSISLKNKNNHFFIVQSDGNVVQYKDAVAQDKAIWSTLGQKTDNGTFVRKGNVYSLGTNTGHLLSLGGYWKAYRAGVADKNAINDEGFRLNDYPV